MASKRKEMDKKDDASSSSDECETARKKAWRTTQYRNVPDHQMVYLENLPCAESYERSYMHRDTVTHVVTTKTDFIITGSCDGHVKFWKKLDEGIEFVKHFRSHLGVIHDLVANVSGSLMCTVASDQTLKVFDVINFDMIHMIKLEFMPRCAEWIHCAGDAIATVAVTDADSGKIYVFDGQSATTEPLHVFDNLHTKPVAVMKFNPRFETIVSVDQAGMLEYWTGPKTQFSFPKCVKFRSKLDTNLYEFGKNKTYPTGLCFSPDGFNFTTIATDRKVRLFKFLTGRLHLTVDESLPRFTELQQKDPQLPHMEFGRRMAVEREIEKAEALGNIVFDESGYMMLYATMLGIKVVNIVNGAVNFLLGKPENLRVLKLALFQGRARKPKAAVTVEMEASDNPTLDCVQTDPTIFCTAYKRNRFYMFTKREPEESKGMEGDRDVFNEKPSKEDIIAATEASGMQRVFDNAVLHSTFGDIHFKLFSKECPRTVENFCVHSKNGYYNGHIFHRVIKGFMVQTGDPTGTGTGGESIWGGEFEDEFHPTLRHDRPYTVSMANAGANSNGSQFFITLTPTPWLDGKHTVFGRVTKGMEVVQNISNVKTNPKTDKPYDEIQILSVTVK
ncbi:hypothetical protein B566_EDAN002644 [Ephemera danica]|nr:hypothetical protein B566_EDAN002644 [Ephemera danica]